MTRSASHKWAILFAVTFTQFAAPFMISSVGVALPSIGSEFQAHGVALSLVESVFLGVSAMCLLVFGRASDLMGRSWLFITGLSIFTVSTVGLGFAWSIDSLIAIRALQAFGGSMQVATGLAILFEVFPPEERGRVLGITMAGIYLGVSAGPFLGGIITDSLGWRWVFFTGTVPCLIALVMSIRAMNRDFRRLEEPFDIPGALLSMACIGLVVYAGANMDTMYGPIALAAAALTLGLFIRVEAKHKNPLLDLGIFRKNPVFNIGNLVQFLNYCAIIGIAFLLSIYLQFGHNMTPAEAGRILFIQPLVQSVLSPFCGRLADKYSPVPLVFIGMLLSAAALGWASFFDINTSMHSIVAVLVIAGTGIALFASPNMNMIMSAVRPSQFGIGTAVTAQMRMMGMTTGMVTISMAISFMVGDQVLSSATFPEFNRAMQFVLRGFCVVGTMGAILTLFSPAKGKGSDPDPEIITK